MHNKRFIKDLKSIKSILLLYKKYGGKGMLYLIVITTLYAIVTVMIVITSEQAL
jgi:hypothetical protein